MKTIRHTATLFYYDGPQVFEARDAIGGYYVAVAVEPKEGHDRYLVSGVAPERLRQFRAGLLELRTLLAEGGQEEWYLASAEAGLDLPLSLQPQSAPIVESDLLPDPGFLLHDRPAESEVLSESRARNNLVLEVAVEPPEAAEEHRIRLDTLVGLLGHVQTMLKHAFGAALRDLPQSARKAIDRSDAHLLDVVIPAGTGSFRVVLEATKAPDMFGHVELARALGEVDVLFEHAGDLQQAMATVKAHRGHLAGAYLRLLRFLGENKTGLRYSWAEPMFSRPSSHAISLAQVGPLVGMLSEVSNLGVERVDLVGSLEKADATSRVWRIATPEGTFSGKTRRDGPTLKGLKIGNSYRFSCDEEFEEIEGTGREHRTLHLVEYEPA